MTLFDLSAYNYDLPDELIASYPAKKRDESRLMIVDRASGSLSEIQFKDLVDWVEAGDQFIFNDTRVIKARLQGQKESGGRVEIFLLKKISTDQWEALAKPGRRLKTGQAVSFSEDFFCEIIQTLENGHKIVQFNRTEDFQQCLQTHGTIPLPHYMKREADFEDEERYQTVFAEKEGALAAPTAGLHFTDSLLKKMEEKGVALQTITLHVGWGTFKPVHVQDIRDHAMHSEWYQITPEAAKELNRPWKRQISVGTTTCRALESVAKDGKVVPKEGETGIFIYPSYEFKFTKALLTNFHLPGSSLLMLVSAFGGYDLIREAYRKAVKERFRFYSYGDAMLVI